MNRWKIGDVSITRVIESETPWDGTLLLPEATAANVRKERDWLHPTFTDDAGWLRMSIHAFVIASRGKRIVVDTRSEEHTSELQSRGHLVCRLLLENKKDQVYAQNE